MRIYKLSEREREQARQLCYVFREEIQKHLDELQFTHNTVIKHFLVSYTNDERIVVKNTKTNSIKFYKTIASYLIALLLSKK